MLWRDGFGMLCSTSAGWSSEEPTGDEKNLGWIIEFPEWYLEIYGKMAWMVWVCKCQLWAWKSFVCSFWCEHEQSTLYIYIYLYINQMNSWQQATCMPGSSTGRNWSLTWRSKVDRFGRLIPLRILWSSLMLILAWEDVFCNGRNLESNDKALDALLECWFSRHPNLSPSRNTVALCFWQRQERKVALGDLPFALAELFSWCHSVPS